MYKFVHKKDNKITSIFTGETKQECIRFIFDRYVRFKLLTQGYYQNKDGSTFEIIRED